MPDQSRVTILLVEDDTVLRQLLSRQLRAAGYEVSEAADGQKAITILEAAGVDILLTDIIMPNREGVETIIEVRKRWPTVKVVAMSGGGRIDPELFLGLAKEFGAHAKIAKPFKFADLKETLDKLMLSGSADS